MRFSLDSYLLCFGAFTDHDGLITIAAIPTAMEPTGSRPTQTSHGPSHVEEGDASAPVRVAVRPMSNRSRARSSSAAPS